MDILIKFNIKKHCQKHSAELSQNRSRSRSRNSHLGKPEKSKDQDRVKNNIDHSTQPLGNHGIKGTSRGLQQPLKHYLHIHSNTECRNNSHILDPIFPDLRVSSLHMEKRFCQQCTQHRKDNTAHKCQKNTVFR